MMIECNPYSSLSPKVTQKFCVSRARYVNNRESFTP
jgi:hypothetical protein